jgi:HEAT repeat protein
MEPPTLRPVVAQSSDLENSPEAQRLLQALADPDEHVRADAATGLGRLKTARALDPLAATLAGDHSPVVRAAAARAMAIIADPRSLLALQRAVQGDPDNDVRRTAQFAMEVIASR